MKKASLLLGCILCFLSHARSQEFRFFPLTDLPLSSQGLAGRIGSRLFLLNRYYTEGIDLFIYDTLTRTGVKRKHAFPRTVSAVMVRDGSIVFLGISPNGNHMRYQYLELGADGEPIRNVQDSLDLLGRGMATVISPDKNHVLLYQQFRQGIDSALVRGTMIGKDGKVEKTLSYIFKHDRERDDEPETFVDNEGNTHVLVFDKFNNYRLSTNLTINTVSIREEAMVSETFTVQKMKLKTMNVFQDSACGCLQAQGTYADGQVKNVRGMYTLSFPMKRQNELRQKFSPFTQEMIRSFRKGFNATDGGICNSLSLVDITHTDSGTYAIFRVSAELVMMQEPRIRSNRPLMEIGNNLSMVLAHSDTWNVPRTICIKLNNSHDIAWSISRGQDMFVLREARYNRMYFGGDAREILILGYQADKSDEPQPVLVSLRDGKEYVQPAAGKFTTFSPMLALDKGLYGSVYLHPATGEGGVMLIGRP